MTRCIRLDTHRYETSRDYQALWDLLQKTPVVCIVDWVPPLERDIACRDICATIWHAGVATIGCRGVCYVWAESLEQFEQQCQKANVEAILPLPVDDREPITPDWLRSIGFEQNRPCQVWGTPNCNWWNGTLEIYDHNDTGNWLWVEHDSVEMRTRGHLRMLMAWVQLGRTQE